MFMYYGKVRGYCLATEGVGERCMRGEAIAEAVVDCIEVRMPE